MSVAQLLQEMGQNAARRQLQRGALVGGAVQSLANAPGQILAMRDQERVQQAQIARANAQATYAQRTDARAQQDQALQDTANAAALKDQADSRAVMGAVYQPDGTMDYAKGFAKAQEIGRLDLGDALKAHEATANKPTQLDPTKDTYVAGKLVTPGVAKPPEIGTPAHEVYLRQQALLQPPAAAPSAAAPALTTLAPAQEQAFQAWYADASKKYDLNPNPEGQSYDYRGAFQVGAKPDASGHWPSDFKQPGHPNEIVGGFNTRTGERVQGTPQASEAELVRLGWDPATAKTLSQPRALTPNAAALQAYDDQRAATAKTKVPELGSFGDYLLKFAAEKGIEPSKLKPADVEAARKKYQQSDDRPRVTVSVGGAGGPGDVKESIAGMKDGTLPPLLPGRASKDYTAIMAEAHRQGYDLARAATDWVATQKHVATMNGAQQLRLNQAINALPEMLDNVDRLATQWKGGRFPVLNKANLALAKGGAYGPEVASVANQLDAQIADVTADLGNVYMGGNSPTDHALGLAGKSLNATWDEKVLHDMVTLAKKNVVIRRNSIANTGVAGASATNSYGSQAAPDDGEAPPRGAPIKVGGFSVVVK